MAFYHKYSHEEHEEHGYIVSALCRLGGVSGAVLFYFLSIL